MTGSEQTDQLRNKTKQFAIGILKLCGPLPKTPETLAIQTPLVKAATTLAANSRALARAWSEDDFHRNRNLASGDADDCVFWLELLAAAGTDQDQPIQALLDEASDIVALLSICGEPENSAQARTEPAEPAVDPPAPAPQPAVPTDFHGLRVLSFESRMGAEMARLIQRHNGLPLVVPAMREIPIPLQDNSAVFRFGVKLILNQLDLLILMTGVGTKALLEILQSRYPLAEIIDALKKTIIVTRGPKPLAVLKTFGVEANITVPEPNTWHDVIATLDYYRPVQGLKIAIQEYGVSKPDMIQDLQKRGAEVFSVPVYRWALPEDTAPLQSAIAEVLNGTIDAMLITNAAQIDHVMQLAEQEKKTELFRERCRNIVVASIGPTASEGLKHYDLPVDFEPSHPKMGVLVKELSEQIHGLRQAKLPPQPG
ncbi:MAG: putative Uroporphyrinogen synthase HemD (modular protein) [Nitrospira sp.]|nr:putative Uroporphyrinogen synthase HemD (modular protein) [Nitrospira sp.]